MATPHARDLGRLRREWYGRLRDEGFRDIESILDDGSTAPLIATSIRTDRGSRLVREPDACEATSYYFSRAGAFLASYSFGSDVDRDVWSLHVEGASFRRIGRELGIPTKRAFDIVHRLRRAMDNQALETDTDFVVLPRRRHIDPTLALTEAQWQAVAPLVETPRGPRRGRPARPTRAIVAALAWLLRSGAPWRELPVTFGDWRTVYHRWRQWVRAGVWMAILQKFGEYSDTLSSRVPLRFGMVVATS